MKNHGRKILKATAHFSIAVAFIFLLLAYWPEPSFPSPSLAKTKLFEWDRKELFDELENEFLRARRETEYAVRLNGDLFVASRVRGSYRERYEKEEANIDFLLDQLEAQKPGPRPETLAAIEKAQFTLASFAAVQPELLPRFRKLTLALRGRVLRAAVYWGTPTDLTRQALFRIITGGRMAFEEALVQQSSWDDYAGVEAVEDIASKCPCTEVDGVRLCSGDIFLSRGDAPTSALIARTNFFPGEFSHAALVYVGKNGAPPMVLESLIEEGSMITPLAEFMKSHRHRLVLLRLRPESPECVKDPLLPHKAAVRLHDRFAKEKVPYDFAMLPDDDSSLFCSEAVASAYSGEGASIFPGRSRLDTPGIIRMMGPLGVRKFDSYMPQDLELNPSLSEAAEWFYPETLRKDRIEEAVLSALFWEAERGASLQTPRTVLAGSRLVKGFSSIQSFLGFRPIVPSGMSASSAARLHCYIKRVYPVLYKDVSKEAESFVMVSRRSFEAPRWVLARLAEQAVKKNRERLKPYFR